jgi:Ala-tRNA(Pro) deacylase
MGIAYTRHEHPPVFTVVEAERYWKDIEATHCKNLFVRNKKGNAHYLVVVERSKRVDLKRLAVAVGDDRLSFASPDRMARLLGLTAGAVSPFGLINDVERHVIVVLDADLRGPHQLLVVEARVQVAGVDHAPAVAEGVAVVAVDVEALLAVPLQDRERVVLAVQQHVDGLAAELAAVEAVEQHRAPAALRVADLAGEDRGLGRLGPPVLLEVGVAEVVDQELAQVVRRARERDVARER